MKAIACLIIFLTNLSTCNSQHIKDIYIPEITKETEYFDPNNFSFEPKNEQLSTDNNVGAKYINMQFERYYERDEDGNTIVNYYKNGKGEIDGYVYPYNSIIGIRKVFYKSGNLKTKGLLYYSGLPIGIWYEFNENGKLVNSIDKNKGYPFGWKDVFAFCKKNEISLEKNRNRKKTSITNYIDADGKYYWNINYVNKYTKGESTTFILNGENGEVLSKIEEEWYPHKRRDED